MEWIVILLVSHTNNITCILGFKINGITIQACPILTQTKGLSMYTLHYYPGNANLAPHMLLEELGVKYQLVMVERDSNAQKSLEYLQLNPIGRIPALADGELSMFESAAIILHLVDKHPEAKMAPKVATPERAMFYQWLIFLTNSLQEEVMIWHYPERLTGEDKVAEEVVKRASELRASNYLDVIERHLGDNGPYFLGSTVSAVDLYLTMLAGWAQTMKHPPRSRENVSRLLDLISDRPAVKRAYEGEGLTGVIA